MQELSDKLRRGLQLAEQRLLERNARHGNTKKINWLTA